MPNKKIVLIDGNSILYRAFYALPTSLTTRSGQVTNAVYGFMTMLLKLIEEREPEAMVVAFDKGRITFRHDILESYKANRPSMPAELVTQLPIIRDLLESMDIVFCELEGYEADDILATLAKQAKLEGFDIDIVTGDKDALQLVDDRTTVVTTKKGITDIKLFRPDDVMEKYGVTPDRMRDWLALKGDSSDNIPGVPGIGDKTATLLLSSHDTVEDLLDDLDGVKNARIRKALEDNIEGIKTAKELVTLIDDVNIAMDWQAAHIKPWDESKLGTLLKALEFDSLYKRIFTKDTRPQDMQGQLFAIDDSQASTRPQDSEDFNRILDLALDDGFMALDIAWSLAGSIYFAVAVKGVTYEFELTDASREDIARLLGASAVKVVYDNKRCHKACRKCRLPWPGLKFDVMLAAYLDDPSNGRYGLDDIALRYLQKSSGPAGDVQTLARSVLTIAEAYETLRECLESADALELLEKVEMPLSEILGDMEEAGISIDVDYLHVLGEEVSSELDEISRKVFAHAGQEFNINSSQQLACVIFDELGLKGRKKTKTGYSTDISVLSEMQHDHPIIPLIIRWRELSKLKSTYIFSLPKLVDEKDHRLHTTFSQVGTATGRLVSTNPNLQNIPVRTDLGLRVRKAFVAGGEDVMFLTADYSQIELRILAHMSKDEKLMESFANDEDIHARTASDVFGVAINAVDREQRRMAKAINFGIIYGMSAFGLARQLGIGVEDAQTYIDNYFATFTGVREFIKKTIADVESNGWVATILNRRRFIPEIRSHNPRIRQFGERLAINSPLQGSAADLIKLAMINIAEVLRDKNTKSEMVLQIHDELLFRVPTEEIEDLKNMVIEKMEHAYPMDVRLKVDVSVVKNWGEAKI